MSAIAIKNCHDIDLSHHAIIEASAGTGKTYTIENIVVRILLETKTTLDKILLVTFTEKATSELKERVRANIEKAMNDCSDDEKNTLQKALDDFDEAAIYTIHGFCNNVLQQYAFENKRQFDLEQVADSTVMAQLLNEQKRSQWQQLYGDNLSDLLRISGYSSSWEDTVLNVARNYQPHCGDRLLPELATESFNDIVKRFHSVLDGLVKLVGPIDSKNIEDSELVQQYSNKLPDTGNRVKRRNKTLVPLMQLAKNHTEKQSGLLADFFDIVNTLGKSKTLEENEKFKILLVIAKKELPLIQACQPTVEKIIKLLDTFLASINIDSLKHCLAINTIQQLAKDSITYKEDHSLISYNDMLRLLDEALGDSAATKKPELLRILQQQYHYALVDEFQDTDKTQWSIFSKIFLGTDRQKLFLIGDPKQAIYSFRGADITSYETAIKHMQTQQQAKHYILEQNWRSMPGLIKAFNTVFSADAWFDKTYSDVIAPDPKDRQSRLYKDETNRAPLTVVNPSNPDDPHDSIEELSQFIVDEIKRLVPKDNDASSNPILIQKGEQISSLTYNDICILVRGHREAQNIEQYLQKAGLPYSYYKKAGIYQSNEARDIYYMLASLAEIDSNVAMRKALLSRFFNIELEDLSQYTELDGDHSISILYRKWESYCEDCQWSKLFHSLLIDTGLSLRIVDNKADQISGERILTNFHHILQTLEQDALNMDLDIGGIVDTLAARRKELEDIDESDDLHRLETEKPKVQIMTIHASKGLEFPVIFLGGGYSDVTMKGTCKFHDNDMNIVYDMAKTDDSKAKHLAEEAKDNLRLYYVALTRAKYKVYIPNFKVNRRLKSPLHTIIYESLQQARQQDPNNSSINYVNADGSAYLGNQVMWTPQLDTMSKGHEEQDKEIPTDLVLPNPLFPTVNIEANTRYITMSSFSRLNAKAHHAHILEDSDLKLDEEDQVEASETDYNDDIQDTNILENYYGTEFGSMLHQVFEFIEFEEVKTCQNASEILSNESCKTCIIDALQKFKFVQADQLEQTETTDLIKAIAGMVWKTLHTSMPSLDGDFKLCQLPDADRIHEMSFLYPLPDANELNIPAAHYSNEGFLVGEIDLVFRYKNRYYIADWKSNYLKDGYSPSAVSAGMDHSNYHLQYQLYSIALLKHLKRCKAGFNFETDFGGSFYFYLRGIQPDSDYGIFFYQPQSEAEINGYEKTLYNLSNPTASTEANV